MHRTYLRPCAAAGCLPCLPSKASHCCHLQMPGLRYKESSPASRGYHWPRDLASISIRGPFVQDADCTCSHLDCTSAKTTKLGAFATSTLMTVS
jgi:hypothetical protein